jgi:uncharacterized protein involved in exopolysaccharide biosynthesis
MTPPNSIIGRLVHLRPFERFIWRAAVFGSIIVVFLLLAVFPERYKAAASMTPSDSASLGLSGAVGQLGAINSVFGNQAAIEVAMRVAKSIYVRDRVIENAQLSVRMKGRDRVYLNRWLDHHVDVRSLRGGIISIEMTDHDPHLAHDVVAAYIDATQQQLTLISRRQTAYKRQVLRELVSDALSELTAAQAKYDSYRLSHGFADPRRSIEATGDRIPMLEADIKGREIALTAARKFYTDDNLTVQQQLAELSAVRGQLATAKTTADKSPDNLGTLVGESSQLFFLERELGISRALYDSYLRFLQGTVVEDLTATSNVRILEDAYVDTGRQYFVPALVGAVAFFLLWMAIEFYRLRPPLGEHLEFRRADD